MKVKKLNPRAGGKPIYDENMVRVTFSARVDQLAWLRNSRNGISRTLRTLIDKAMMEEGFTIPDYNT